MEVIILLLVVACANAYVIETIARPAATVLGYPVESCGCAPTIDYTCGCAPAIDYTCGCTPTIDYTCGCAPAIDYTCGCAPAIDYTCGCRTIEPCGYPVVNQCDCLCQGPYSPILDTGLVFSYVDPRPRSCALAVSDCATIPPLPPVIGCPKYLRQITIPPPFL